MSARLLGLGTAVPSHAIAQRDAESLARRLAGFNGAHGRLLTALYRRTSVARRGSVLIEGEGVPQRFFPESLVAGEPGPSTRRRQEQYERHAAPLAERACVEAIADSGMGPERITHLVTVSCTGFHAPGVDVALIRGLGLRRDVLRTHVGFMGCHGAINGLRVARALAAEDSGAVVLVCAVELCSLHFHYGQDPDKIVANALFADGAAAAVVGSAPLRDGRDGWVLAATGSRLIDGSEEAMTWRIGDHGFEMTLSARVPGFIEEHLPAWIGRWLDGQGVSIGEVGCWAIHPGGPRVLSAVVASLGLSESAAAASRGVLAEHGNMSSPTILFILSRLRQEGLPGPCVAIGFGPGLVIEAALFRPDGR
jgi:predicted naringenin-chalcone synthase